MAARVSVPAEDANQQVTPAISMDGSSAAADSVPCSTPDEDTVAVTAAAEDASQQRVTPAISMDTDMDGHSTVNTELDMESHTPHEVGLPGDDDMPLIRAAQKADVISTWDVAITAARRQHFPMDVERSMLNAILADNDNDGQSATQPFSPDTEPDPETEMKPNRSQKKARIEKPILTSKRRDLMFLGEQMGPQHQNSLGECSGSEPWIQSLFEVVSKDQLRSDLEHARAMRREPQLTLRYGSDCSGVDSPAIAFKSLITSLTEPGTAQDIAAWCTTVLLFLPCHCSFHSYIFHSYSGFLKTTITNCN